MKEIVNIAIYCRVSTSEQNTQNQRMLLEKFANERGWIFSTFEETESTRKTRPIKQRVLAALRKGQFDAVLVYKLDRWARSTVELLLEIKELIDKGIGFISLSDNLDLASASGRLHFSILSAFAEFERSLISERTKAALRVKKEKGIRLGRPVGAKDSKKRRKSGYYIREMKKRETANNPVPINT